MKVIFLGTPSFAVPTLQKLINSKHEVVAVVTQPDKESGRGGKVVFNPVKVFAVKNSIPVFQFKKIRVDGVETLKIIDADVIVTCAYGQILSKEILEMKKYGVLNVHGSLLPKYRGASPIQCAIINGEEKTGVTILKSDVGIDDGKMLLSESVDIKKYETSEELFERLSIIGAELLIDALQKIEDGTAKFIEQDHSKATFCKMFKSDFGKLDFNNTAKDIVNLIHGLNPSPIAFFKLNNKLIKVYRAEILEDEDIKKWNFKPLKEYKNGEIVESKSKIGLIIKCEDGFVGLTELQAENSRKMCVKDFLNGRAIEKGLVITNE